MVAWAADHDPYRRHPGYNSPGILNGYEVAGANAASNRHRLNIAIERHPGAEIETAQACISMVRELSRQRHRHSGPARRV